MAEIHMFKPAQKQDAHLWEREPDNWYVEPSWTSRRLFQVEEFTEVLDPACGLGRIVKTARAAGLKAVGSDLRHRWIVNDYDLRQADFFGSWPPYAAPIWQRPKSIVCNPPFPKVWRFLELALTRAERKVAFLLPTTIMNGKANADRLSKTPLYRVWLLSPRPSMPPGPVIQAGIKPSGGRRDFAWFVWLNGYQGDPTLHWLQRDQALGA